MLSANRLFPNVKIAPASTNETCRKQNINEETFEDIFKNLLCRSQVTCCSVIEEILSSFCINKPGTSSSSDAILFLVKTADQLKTS